LCTHLDVLAGGRGGAEEAGLGALAQHANGPGLTILLCVEESAVNRAQASDSDVTWLDAEKHRQVHLRLGEDFGGNKALARRRGYDASKVRLDNAIVLKRQSRRGPTDFVVGVVIGRFLRFDDEVAHAELLDEGHHFLLRPGTDG